MVIDLKVGKLTHGDLGQMQLYVNYYDREVAAKGDNPTIGLLLCSEKNDAVVRYVLGDKTEQILPAATSLPCPARTICVRRFGVRWSSFNRWSCWSRWNR